jgi:hypothetical protein
MLDHHLWIRIARISAVKHVPGLLAAARHHEAAKNVSQAVGFGRETLRLLEWIQNQSDLSLLVEQNKREIKGGAYRLNARYLLDGEQYSDALKSHFWPDQDIHWIIGTGYFMRCGVCWGGKNLSEAFTDKGLPIIQERCWVLLSKTGLG